MPGYRNITGTWRFAVPWRNIAGTWKRGILWRNIAGTWKVVAGQITASTNNPFPFGDGPGAATQTIISNSVTIDVQYGSGNYSYLWSRLDGDPAILPTSNNQRTDTFRATVNVGQVREATWRMTVTDLNFGMTATVDVFVHLQNQAGAGA